MMSQARVVNHKLDYLSPFFVANVSVRDIVHDESVSGSILNDDMECPSLWGESTACLWVLGGFVADGLIQYSEKCIS